MRIRKVTILLLIIFLTINCFSQETYKENIKEGEKELQLPDEYMKNRVVIYNISNKQVKFSLGESTDQLEKFELEPEGNGIYGEYSSRPVFEIYTTTEIFSRYRLRLGKLYEIYWNNSENKWDLKQIVLNNQL